MPAAEANAPSAPIAPAAKPVNGRLPVGPELVSVVGCDAPPGLDP
jgi:hypothetical protein